MSLSRNQILKEKQVDVIQKHLQLMNTLLLVSLKNLTVVEIQTLKKQLKVVGNTDDLGLQFYKNSLLKRAVVDSKWEQISSFINGMMFIVSSAQSSLDMIKVVFKFLKDKTKVKFICGFFEGRFLSAEQIVSLALIPNKDELLKKIILTLKMSAYPLLLTLNKVYENKEKKEKLAIIQKTQ